MAELDTNDSAFAISAEEPVRKRRSIFTRSVLRSEEAPPEPNERVYVAPLPYPDAVETPKASVFEEDVKNGTCKVITTSEKVYPTGDEGPFYLPITIKDKRFPHVICDSGASVNTIPLVTALKIGYEPKDFTVIDFTVSLADRTERKPVGMLEDVEVIIGGVKVPNDFLVMDTGNDDPEFMILGRPFLCTTGAKMDFKERTIDLDFGWKSMRFYTDDVVLRPHTIVMAIISTPTGEQKLLKETREKFKDREVWKKRNTKRNEMFIKHENGDPPNLQQSPQG